jgi:hypothetical protein
MASSRRGRPLGRTNLELVAHHSSPQRLAAARGRHQWPRAAGRSKDDMGMLQQNGGAAETWTAWATAIIAVGRW